MTLRHMKIFHALCENDCNTTRTAASLNMTQPAVSLAIKEIEHYYGVVLFDRNGRKLSITPAGKRFRSYCDSMEILFSDMESEMKNWDRQGLLKVGGTLTIGTCFLPQYVSAFNSLYPDIKINGFCGPANILEQKILANELDFAFSEGISTNPDIIAEAYADDRLDIIAPADGRFENNQTITIQQLRQCDMVLRELGSGTRKVFDMACENAGFRISPVWECTSNFAIMSAVINGIGLGVMSHRLTRKAVENGRIVSVNVQGLNLDRKFYTIRHRNKQLTSAAKYFLYLCNENEFEIPNFI